MTDAERALAYLTLDGNPRSVSMIARGANIGSTEDAMRAVAKLLADGRVDAVITPYKGGDGVTYRTAQ